MVPISAIDPGRSESASPSFLCFFEFDVDDVAFESPAVELGDRGTSLVAFHFNKTEAFAAAGKYVPGELERMDAAKGLE